MLTYTLTIPDFENQSIAFVPAGLFSGPRLLVDRHPPAAGPGRGQMRLVADDGREVIAVWKPRLLGLDLPLLVVDGQPIETAEPVRWYQLLWSVIPLLLVVGGGVLGVLCGFIGAYLNLRVFRYARSPAMKYMVSALITVMAFSLYLLLGILVVIFI